MADAQQPGSPTTRQFVEDLGKALALAVVLLPASGVLVRTIAFFVARTVNSPVVLALDAPPGDLITTGLFSLLPGLLVLPMALTFPRKDPRLAEAGQELVRIKEALSRLDPAAPAPRDLVNRLAALERDLSEFDKLYNSPTLRVYRWAHRYAGKWLDRMMITQLVLVYLAYVIFFPAWPLVLAILGPVIALYGIPRIANRRGRATLADIWPLVVISLFIAAIVAGIGGVVVGPEAAGYHFAPAAHLKDGRYVNVGESNNATLLLLCDSHPTQVLAVNESLVMYRTLQPWHDYPLTSAPNLWAVLHGHGTPLGFQPPC